MAGSLILALLVISILCALAIVSALIISRRSNRLNTHLEEQALVDDKAFAEMERDSESTSLSDAAP